MYEQDGDYDGGTLLSNRTNVNYWLTGFYTTALTER